MREHDYVNDQQCWCVPQFEERFGLWAHQAAGGTAHVINMSGAKVNDRENTVNGIIGEEVKGLGTLVDQVETIPTAWFELMRAIALLSKHATNEIRPFQCSHDQLWVCADPEKFTDIEIAQLEEWGFMVSSDGGFYSFRYGSA